MDEEKNMTGTPEEENTVIAGDDNTKDTPASSGEILEEASGEDTQNTSPAAGGTEDDAGTESSAQTALQPADDGNSPKGGKKGTKKSAKKTVLDILIVFCIIGFLVSGYFLMADVIPRIQNAKNIKTIQEVSPMVDTTTDPDKLPSIEYLKEINKDIVGWINIPNTNIDYPLLQCSNNEYYLQYSYNEKWNDAGSIYLDYRNADDFTDQNTVIYGHARYDGSMFAQVLYYKKQSQYEKAPFITIVLEGKVYYYQIFSANILEATADYRKKDYGSSFTSFIKEMRSSSMIKSAAKVDKNSKIITLSTCTNVIEDGRLALFAVLLNPDGEKIDLNDYPV